MAERVFAGRAVFQSGRSVPAFGAEHSSQPTAWGG